MLQTESSLLPSTFGRGMSGFFDPREGGVSFGGANKVNECLLSLFEFREPSKVVKLSLSYKFGAFGKRA
jgi:hypothetical protein